MIDRSSFDCRRTGFVLDDLCSEFEDQWDIAKPLGALIAEFLCRVDDELKHALAVELIACDLELRGVSQPMPCRQDYLQCLVGYDSAIESAFELMNLENARTSPTPQANVPERLGDFRIIREIGRGGMGVVYEAEQETLGRHVAIKTLFAHPLLRPEATKRFARESRTIASLHHTNIVDVFGSGEESGIHYFAMQLVRGSSLRDFIRERQKVRQELENYNIYWQYQQEVIQIGLQVAQALEYAHRRGVLHRDIKPSNLLLDETGEVQVTDFGLAKLTQEDDGSTKVGDVIGTLKYLSPESIEGHWDERGDIYGLGATLYELLTLQPAISGVGNATILDNISRGVIIPPRKINPRINSDVETVVMKAMASDPCDRYQTAEAMAGDLQRILNVEPIRARRTGYVEHLGKWSKRNPSLAALWFVLMLAAFVGIPVLASLWRRATIARADAEFRQAEAEQARELANAREYGSRIQLAQQFLNDGIASEAVQLLDEIENDLSGGAALRRQDRRDWEWQFLQEQLDSSELSLAGHNGAVHAVAISPDDRLIATVSDSTLNKNMGYKPGEVILWDRASGESKHVFPGDSSGVTDAAFSADGLRLATISFKAIEQENNVPGTIKVWDTDSGELLQELEQIGEHPRRLISGFFGKVVRPRIRYSADGKWLASWPDPIEVRDARSGRRVYTIPGSDAVFLPGDRLLAKPMRGPLRIYDLQTGELIRSGPVIYHPLYDSAVDSMGVRLSCVFREEVHLWNLSEMHSRKFKTPEIQWGRITPNGRTIVFGDRSGLLHFVSLDGDQLEEFRLGHRSGISDGAFSHSGQFLVTASYDGTARVWNLEQNARPFVVETKLGSDSIGDISFGDDSRTIQFAASRSKQAGDEVGWQSLDGKERATRTIDTTFCTHWPRNDFAYSPDGRFLAAPAAEAQRPVKRQIVGFAQSKRINVWSSHSLSLLASIDINLSEITCTAWSPEASQLAVAGSEDNQHRVLVFSLPHLTADKPAFVDSEKHVICVQEQVTAMDFHPHANQLAIGTQTGVHLHSLGTETTVENATGLMPFSAVVYLDFSAQGDRLAVASQEQRAVAVFDVQTGRLIYRAPAPRRVSCVRFSPNGRRLAMVGYESLVDLCDAATGIRLLTLRGAESAPGEVAFTPRVIFSHDGRRIATNDWQGRITTWEVSTALTEKNGVGAQGRVTQSLHKITGSP